MSVKLEVEVVEGLVGCESSAAHIAAQEDRQGQVELYCDALEFSFVSAGCVDNAHPNNRRAPEHLQHSILALP